MALVTTKDMFAKALTSDYAIGALMSIIWKSFRASWRQQSSNSLR